MKTKKLEKKLVLNKKTVTKLSKSELKKLKIRGGGNCGGTEHTHC